MHDIFGLMYACVAVHNFIRRTNKLTDDFVEAELDEDDDEADDDGPEPIYNGHENLEAGQWRDVIATEMWEDYVVRRANHH